MENSAAEISNEPEKVEIEVNSWDRQRSTEQRLGLIARREAFLNSQHVEL